MRAVARSLSRWQGRSVYWVRDRLAIVGAGLLVFGSGRSLCSGAKPGRFDAPPTVRKVAVSDGSDLGLDGESSQSKAMGPGKEAGTPTGDEMRAALDMERFRKEGHKVVDFVADYYKNVHKMPVKSPVKPGYLAPMLPKGPPDEGEPLDDVLADVENLIMPGVTHWQSPRFMAYFPAGSSWPGLIGEMLSGMFNVIGFSWVASPAASELETVMLDWLGELLDLPEEFHSSGTGGGVIQGTASEATLVALLAARARALEELAAAGGGEVDQDAASARFVVYTSEQAHSSVQKAAMIAGIPLSRFRKIKTAAPGYKVEPAVLDAAMAADEAKGLKPIFFCATIGTTGVGAFDPLSPLGDVCARHGAWMHADMAWAGSACICPEYRPLLDGVEKCDSLDFNPHKWLLTNFDCSAMWIKDRRWLRKALSLTPEYLRSKEYDTGLVQDYRDWQVPLGRRFRSLKLWLVMRTLGAKTLRSFIREHCRLAESFAQQVRDSPNFELVTPVSLSLVCFRLAGVPDSVSQRAMEIVNESGQAFLVNTKLDGRYVIRLAVGNAQTTDADIERCFSLLEEAAEIARAEHDAASKQD